MKLLSSKKTGMVYRVWQRERCSVTGLERARMLLRGGPLPDIVPSSVLTPRTT